MKFKNLVAIAMMIIGFSSCSSTFYYQVYKVKTESKNSTSADGLVFEDENCIIHYNLWAENGDLSFEFYNKTEENIYLDKTESFFVLNGKAYDYFQNRVYSKSSSQGVSSLSSVSRSSSVSGLYSNLLQPSVSVATNKLAVKTIGGVVASSASSVSYNEPKVVCIPSKTTKSISGFSINSSLYRDCDLFKYPTRKQINAKSFNSEDSPLVFENRFQYSIGESKEMINFKNDFYVEEIANYPMSDMFELDYEEYCGDKSFNKVSHFTDYSSSTFYIRYTKTQSTFKH
jgi:hypothetical protein